MPQVFLAMTAEELEQLVRRVFAEEIAKRDASLQPDLLDRKQLAKALGVSPATVDRLRAEAGFPEYAIGDMRRFRLEEVLRWARERGELAKGGRALRLVKGER